MGHFTQWARRCYTNIFKSPTSGDVVFRVLAHCVVQSGDPICLKTYLSKFVNLYAFILFKEK